ncbi:MAG TPA: HAD-IC family P-type ATPase, partial [Dermatophilaceae bacterium]|nr:HAD-IC family P-type ATPase [Dermatophilaceae bacterium]
TGERGLTSAEVAQRVGAGLVNRATSEPSRSVGEILRANLLTRFNALLGGLLVAILVVGPLQDALFGFVLVANSAIGIIQELRAKRTLDRLSLLSMPTSTVVRDGQPRQVAAADVVCDDVLVVGLGDQIVVDAVATETDGLEVDESLLSGESEPVDKRPGDQLLSGSFVVAGHGRVRATRVGDEAYAVRLASEAKRFDLVSSQIMDDLNRLLRWITAVLVPTAALLVTTQLLVHKQSLSEALRGSVAGVVGMVPEGLVLLTSVAFAVAVVRLGGRGVLVQELPAIEGLARVDVVGIDKTGTLTEGPMAVDELVPLRDGAASECAECAQALGAIAHADEHPNPSLRALAAAYPAPATWRHTGGVPFSSARKWSATSFDAHGTWVLGAPDVLLGPGSLAREEAERRQATGRRVLLLARATAPLAAEAVPPLEPAALVVLAERLRPDAADTLRYFAEGGVQVKLISGDSPRTVGAVASALGMPGAHHPLDAAPLGDDLAAISPVVEESTVFGRVRPRQKQTIVAALRDHGHVVAMTGDGVNDVIALKEADLGVAMGSGAPAARAVADLVLLRNRFDVLPDVVAEGRRVIANIERVAHLFLTKTVYVTVLTIAVGVAQLPFPFYPRHLTIVSALTIGVPAFFLALAPNRRRARPGFLRRVLRFAVPAGVVAAAATFAAYAVTTLETDLGVPAARTAATIVLFGAGTTVLALIARPLRLLETALLAALVAVFAALLAVPWLREFLALSSLPLLAWASNLALVGLTAGALTIVWWFSLRRDAPVDRDAPPDPPALPDPPASLDRDAPPDHAA